MAGKTPTIELKDGFGKATYNSKTMRIDFHQLCPLLVFIKLRKIRRTRGEKAWSHMLRRTNPILLQRPIRRQCYSTLIRELVNASVHAALLSFR
jgi:hypothetical protein